MIGQRYAVAGRSVVTGRRAASPSTERLAGVRGAISKRLSIRSLVKNSELTQLMIAMGLISLAFLIFLSQAGQVSVHQFNIADVRRDQLGLRMQNANLHATATQLQSLKRVQSVAASMLHLGSPDITKTVWIQTVQPHVAPVVGSQTELTAAKLRSQPTAWLQHALHVVESSL